MEICFWTLVIEFFLFLKLKEQIDEHHNTKFTKNLFLGLLKVRGELDKIYSK
jgi:hypothetical protein